jgi:hypothetical protein
MNSRSPTKENSSELVEKGVTLDDKTLKDQFCPLPGGRIPPGKVEVTSLAALGELVWNVFAASTTDAAKASTVTGQGLV